MAVFASAINVLQASESPSFAMSVAVSFSPGLYNSNASTFSASCSFFDSAEVIWLFCVMESASNAALAVSIAVLSAAFTFAGSVRSAIYALTSFVSQSVSLATLSALMSVFCRAVRAVYAAFASLMAAAFVIATLSGNGSASIFAFTASTAALSTGSIVTVTCTSTFDTLL